MWNTHFGRTWMWDHLVLYTRISCMVLTSSFGIIHTNGLHHSLELSALTGECPCSQRKVCTISRVAFPDRKSTRLNSSHTVISYAVFCLKKKNKKNRSCGRLFFNKC